jgi:hypothetical protein
MAPEPDGDSERFMGKGSDIACLWGEQNVARHRGDIR